MSSYKPDNFHTWLTTESTELSLNACLDHNIEILPESWKSPEDLELALSECESEAVRISILAQINTIVDRLIPEAKEHATCPRALGYLSATGNVRAMIDEKQFRDDTTMLRAVLRAGTSEEKRKMAALCAQNEKDPIQGAVTSSIIGHEESDWLHDVEVRCMKYFADYGLGKMPSLQEFVNAAGELITHDYDLVVGVLSGGKGIPNYMEMLGADNVRYVEWHKHWKREPVWRNVGRVREKIKQADRILVCENDVNTGKTIRNLIPTLETLNPKEVDLCIFCGDESHTQNMVADAGFYRTTVDARHLNRSKTYHHFEALDAALQ